jgi:hypothetical protein
MTIDELYNKHDNACSISSYLGNSSDHRNISIEFAIKVLEEQKFIISDNENLNPVDMIDNKIQELKQHLDEKI